MVDEHTGEARLDREEAKRLVASGTFFWIDLHRPTAEEFAILREVFGFHPLALEDSEHFGQRPKVEEYDDFVFLVLYGAVPDDGRLVEVHCFYSQRFLVTIRHDRVPAVSEVRRKYEAGTKSVREPIWLAHRLVDALVDSFMPVLAGFDDRVEDVEDRAFHDVADEQQLQEISALKRTLVRMRKVVESQRDVFASLVGGVVELPGMTHEAERYFRDTHDHLIRVSGLIDTYRDLLTTSTDVFLSTVSNRQNAVMKQLTVISTVFLPLSFISGFFGQNFGWMVDHLGGAAEFAALGVGLNLVAVLLMVIFFKRRRWF
ncbi:magnesium/cobalt transporter CorA [Kribbella sp. NPDC004536]|uniref:magnesium/cobalt transporter CorA n=1 Tax=Kribbella sp. NPDC004536 TaxID=3364106 RepID=UPI00367E17D6